MPAILIVDQGTTETTAMLVEDDLRIIAVSSFENPLRCTKEGFVEHLALDIKTSVKTAILDVIKLSQIDISNIIGIGITNQRETTCLFYPDGTPAVPFIGWQCRRSADICENFKKNSLLSSKIHEITGLHLDPYFSATKLKWLFDTHPNLKQHAKNKKLLFGTIDTYLAHWFSGGELHITDASNASRTMLMDLNSCSWSKECLEIFKVPENCLPKIVPNIGPYGKTKGLDFLPDGILIASMIGDQQAAMVGQRCFDKGSAKATFGTGCFILQNLGSRPVLSCHGLLTSIGYLTDKHHTYCMEGSAFAAGAGIQFLRDNFKFIKNAKDIQTLAESVPDSGGVIFIPGFSGIGAPLWKPDTRAAIFGLSRTSKQGHVARALLEGIALQNAMILNAMAEDQAPIRSLKVDGGAAQNDLLMQIQADMAGIECIRDSEVQKTALGAAILAALALGFISSLNSSPPSENIRKFSPQISAETRNMMLKNYRSYLEKM